MFTLLWLLILVPEFTFLYLIKVLIQWWASISGCTKHDYKMRFSPYYSLSWTYLYILSNLHLLILPEVRLWYLFASSHFLCHVCHPHIHGKHSDNLYNSRVWDNQLLNSTKEHGPFCLKYSGCIQNIDELSFLFLKVF
jgi:hypothetical protein